jgi:valyl-tRNA synthetase
MGILMDVITGIRNVRGEMNISPTMALQVLIQSEDDKTRKIMETHQDLIINLARLSSLEVQNTGEKPKSSATAVVNNASIFVLLEGIIDFAKETKRLDKEIKKLAAELTSVAKKLQNEGFLSKAPPDVIEKVRNKQGVLLEKQQKIQTNLDRIKAVED